MFSLHNFYVVLIYKYRTFLVFERNIISPFVYTYLACAVFRDFEGVSGRWNFSLPLGVLMLEILASLGASFRSSLALVLLRTLGIL